MNMEGPQKVEQLQPQEQMERGELENVETKAQTSVAKMFKVDGMFDSEMTAGGKIKSIEKVLQHGIQHSSERF